MSAGGAQEGPDGEATARSTAQARAVASRVARESYGRFVAWLAWQWRDLAAAEDAMASALEKALALWPTQGIPTSPDAWLLSVARRELLQSARRTRLHESPEVQALLAHDEAGESGADGTPAVPDARLKLLFVCAHPAIDAAIRPALMLQSVLGVEAQAIAQAVLTTPAAMAQRLVRAKQKIRDAGLRFEEPDADELPERVHAVLEAIYAAYGLGWDAVDGGDVQTQGLRAEALYLGELVARLLPRAPEAKGLLALMLYCEARVPARHTAAGDFVPLGEQDTARWDADLIAAAESLLREAARQQVPGPFQLEAAIQSAHCQRLFTGQTPWSAIAALYGRLLAHAPGIGAEVAHAMAWAQAGDPDRARVLLDALDVRKVAAYQPYWVARAQVARLAGDDAAWRSHLSTAIGLTSTPATRRFLSGQLG